MIKMTCCVRRDSVLKVAKIEGVAATKNVKQAPSKNADVKVIKGKNVAFVTPSSEASA
jgi:hypothetical protein